MSNLFTAPPKQALLRMVAPISVGFIMLMAIDYADALVAGFISVKSLAIVGYCYPVLYFMIAIGFGLNQGMTIVASKDYIEEGSPSLYRWLIQSTYLALLVSFALCASVVFVLKAQVINSAFIISHIADIQPYMYVLLLAVFPTFLLLLLCAVCQIKGQPESIRNVLGIMFIGTCVLHPILAIFFEFGLVGVAISKVVNVMLGVIYLLHRIIGPDAIREGYRFQFSRQRVLCHHAFPASLIQLLVPVYLLYLTQLVTHYGINALAGFHLGYRIVMFVVVPILGTLVALLALISHAYNEGNHQRIKDLLNVSISNGSIVVLVALVLTYTVSRIFFMNLNETELIALSYILAAVYFTVLEYLIGVFIVSFQAVKRPLLAFSVALTRTVIFPFPIFYWLYSQGLNQFSLYEIWYALMISFTISAMASYLIWYVKFYNHQ